MMQYEVNFRVVYNLCTMPVPSAEDLVVKGVFPTALGDSSYLTKEIGFISVGDCAMFSTFVIVLNLPTRCTSFLWFGVPPTGFFLNTLNIVPQSGHFEVLSWLSLEELVYFSVVSSRWTNLVCGCDDMLRQWTLQTTSSHFVLSLCFQ